MPSDRLPESPGRPRRSPKAPPHRGRNSTTTTVQLGNHNLPRSFSRPRRGPKTPPPARRPRPPRSPRLRAGTALAAPPAAPLPGWPRRCAAPATRAARRAAAAAQRSFRVLQKSQRFSLSCRVPGSSCTAWHATLSPSRNASSRSRLNAVLRATKSRNMRVLRVEGSEKCSWTLPAAGPPRRPAASCMLQYKIDVKMQRQMSI